MQITLDLLQAAVPAATRENLEKFHDGIVEVAARFDISNPSRLAMFLAQCAHESANFSSVEENLNYSVRGLLSTWPSRFAGIADEYARKPEKIANRAYCLRMGNGDEQSGDGWRYRGRGIIQLTGRDNYAAASRDLCVNLVDYPEQATDGWAAALTAGWFWNRHSLNALSDAHDVTAVTRAINGGTLGLQERTEAFNRIFQVLSTV